MNAKSVQTEAVAASVWEKNMKSINLCADEGPIAKGRHGAAKHTTLNTGYGELVGRLLGPKAARGDGLGHHT